MQFEIINIPPRTPERKNNDLKTKRFISIVRNLSYRESMAHAISIALDKINGEEAI